MMDSKMISAIVNVIKQSDMSDLNLVSIVERPIVVKVDEKGCETYSEQLNLSDSFGYGKAHLSDAWVASNIMLFTVYDGFLENKYGLIEGESFRNHYNNLKDTSQIEKIEKDCYRILKLVRNAIQHNMSSIVYDQGAYSISYTFRNTNYNLRISRDAMRFLYTVVLNIICGEVFGIYDDFKTDGHYIGIMNTMYDQVRNGIEGLSDEIGGDLIGDFHMVGNYDATHLRTLVRYPVTNPVILYENEEYVIFKHIENNITDNEMEKGYLYSTDYTYDEFLLPQEMGVITKKDSGDLQERLKNSTIKFFKADIKDLWKLKNIKMSKL